MRLYHWWPLLLCALLRAEDRVYKMGYSHAPPNQMVDANGQPYGLAIEVVSEAARRAGVRLQWVHQPNGAESGLRDGLIDLFPLFTELPHRAQYAYFSEPWRTTTYALVWRTDSGVTKPEGFGARRIATTPDRWVAMEVRSRFPSAKTVIVDVQQDVLKAICDGRADGGLLFSNPTTFDGFEPEPSCGAVGLRSMRLEESGGRVGIAARRVDRAAITAADRIRHEIDGMWADGTMAGAFLKWLAATSYERETIERLKEAQRVNFILRCAALVALALAVLLAYLAWRLRRATLAKSAFLASMSHEIRTPLNGVLGMAELLGAGELGSGQREMVTMMRESGESLLAILNEILDSAKLEAGHMVFAARPFDFWNVAEATASMFWATGWSRGVDVQVQIHAGTPRNVVGDAVRVRQIVMNLVGNALRFTDSGSVVIALTGADKGVRILVRDTGMGIPIEQQQRIFEPFLQRADQTHGGTGLGLSLCKRMAEQMGGRISVKSEPGKGATFEVFLPLRGEPTPLQEGPGVLLVPASEEALAHTQSVLGALGLPWTQTDRPLDPALRFGIWNGAGDPPAGCNAYRVALQGRAVRGALPVMHLPLLPSRLLRMEAPKETQQLQWSGYRVLVVDDNGVNQRVVSGLLERAGCQVELAGNGIEGVAKARDGFDLILMDCLMPEMDGWAATQAIRALEEGGPATYIVALTANAFAEDRERCTSAGMDDFLAKPVRSTDLFRVLAAARARREAPGEASPAH